MKKLLVVTLFILLSGGIWGQNCEQIAKDCNEYLNGKKGKEVFISDGQVYTAFLDNEKAEFKTTLFGGSVYRIAASAGREENYVIFNVIDPEGNILFTNKKHKNSPYWDFKIPQTIPVTIQAELDSDLKVTGCAVLMIGFKQY